MTGSRIAVLREAWVGRAEAFLVWRRSGHLAGRAALAAGAACLMGLLAQVRIYTPLSPVPLTGQTFGALVVGGLCGMEMAVLSMGLYLALGVAGVPWFAHAGSGPEFLVSATAGYLVGFVLAAALVGYLTDRHPGTRSFAPALGVMAAGSFLILAAGFVGLVVLCGMSPAKAFAGGVVVFIPGDLVKAVLAAGILSAGLPRRAGPAGP